MSGGGNGGMGGYATQQGNGQFPQFPQGYPSGDGMRSNSMIPPWAQQSNTPSWLAQFGASGMNGLPSNTNFNTANSATPSFGQEQPMMSSPSAWGPAASSISSGAPSVPTMNSANVSRGGGNDYSNYFPSPPRYTGQPFTGGNMNVPPQMPPQMPMQQPMQPPMQPQRPPIDPAVQAYMNQNYFPGIHGGPDPSTLTMPSQDPSQGQPQPKGLVMSENQPNALARPLTGPTGTVNGPGGLQFTPPGQPTQLFGPTAGLFAGVQRPQDVSNTFGYYPGTQQWGAPNMGWASQWGKQPGT